MNFIIIEFKLIDFIEFQIKNTIFISRNPSTHNYIIYTSEKYCPFDHSSNDIFFNNEKNYIDHSSGYCNLCTKEHLMKEFETWTSGNDEIDKVIQENQTSNSSYYYSYPLQWIPYDNFQDITHPVDVGYGTVYSAILKDGIKDHWNFNTRNWEYESVGGKVALKEIRDSRYDISEILKEVRF